MKIEDQALQRTIIEKIAVIKFEITLAKMSLKLVVQRLEEMLRIPKNLPSLKSTIQTRFLTFNYIV